MSIIPYELLVFTFPDTLLFLRLSVVKILWHDLKTNVKKK